MRIQLRNLSHCGCRDFYSQLFSVEGCIGFTDMRGDPEPPESLAVAGEFLFMPRPVFRITHNNVTANDMI